MAATDQLLGEEAITQRRQVEESFRRRWEAHEQIRRLVAKTKKCFEELDRLDMENPVGMGGEIGGFLEGFLEEVLVRVEAEDE
jgi:serine/threonine-protein kinase 24/25/MST4